MSTSATGSPRRPDIHDLMRRRSRLRWGFSAVLIGAYLVWGVLGVYFADFYAAPFFGHAMPIGIALAFGIIGLSMLLAFVYVRLINQIEAEVLGTGGRDQ